MPAYHGRASVVPFCACMADITRARACALVLTQPLPDPSDPPAEVAALHLFPNGVERGGFARSAAGHVLQAAWPRGGRHAVMALITDPQGGGRLRWTGPAAAKCRHEVSEDGALSLPPAEPLAGGSRATWVTGEDLQRVLIHLLCGEYALTRRGRRWLTRFLREQ